MCPSVATRLHYFYEILSVCTRLQVAFKLCVWSLSGDKQPSYKDIPAVGAFSHKFSVAPSGETADRIKKGCYYHAKYGGDRWSRAGCRRKSVMLFLSVCFLSRFGMTKFVITETLWSSAILKTIMVSLHTGRFAVMQLFLWTPRIFT